MESLWKDLRYALRSFGKSRGFTVAALLALALGIGANAAIFSVVYTVLFRPLPYPDPGKLVMVWQTRSDLDPSQFPNPKMAAALFNHWLPDNTVFERWRERGRSFERIAGFRWEVATLTGAGEPERPVGLLVTPQFFDVIGAHPKIGRTFLPEEDRPDNNSVVVLSDGLWRRRFRSDPGILGRKIVFDGVPQTVIGVMPAGFRPVLPGSSREPGISVAVMASGDLSPEVCTVFGSGQAEAGPDGGASAVGDDRSRCLAPAGVTAAYEGPRRPADSALR